MKKLFVLAAVSLVATSANAAEMKWNGGASYFYTIQKEEDGLSSKTAAGKDMSTRTTKAHWIAASLGATGGWEAVEWGLGFRTGGAGTVNIPLVNVQGGGDRAFALEQAWFRYLKDFGSLNLNLTIGRQMNVLAYNNVEQTLFDADSRFDGFGWKFNYGMFGLNAAQYILGAGNSGTEGASTYSKTEASESNPNTVGRFNYLMAIQPHMTWKFSDDIETFLAVGYYKWNDNSNANTIGSGATWNTATTGSGAPVAQNASLNMHSPRQWHFYNSWTLPYSLKFRGEFVMTNKVKYADGMRNTTNSNRNVYYTINDGKTAEATAWSLGLSYGSLGKAQDYMLSYSYGTKGEGSVINRYTYESFSADRKGHMLNAGYSMADNFNLGLEMIFLTEKNVKNPTTGETRTGANAAEKYKSSYYNIYAGVSF